MKKLLIALLVILIMAVHIGCSKEKRTIVQNDWEVVSLKLHSDSTLIFPTKEYTLVFNDSRSFSISLDVNGCSGKVKFRKGHSLRFYDIRTTLVCCDSPFAESLMANIDVVQHYAVEDNTLYLTGEAGEVISLKRK
ncbi:MAG: META domain-containing protein [Bacteroidetes bacterium]|nr:META domain-containing protein [Bacteroidota bacterium]MBU1718443.1 META domain-containing protein [Bacteroidota bacterium]